MAKEILGVTAPKNECTDIKCPFHGALAVKKELAKGVIVKKDINHSATIEWKRPYYIPKYERYEVRKSRMRVHNPACIDATIGKVVLVARTRPLSKTKNHVILKVIEEDNNETKETAPKKAKKVSVKESKEVKETKSNNEITENESN